LSFILIPSLGIGFYDPTPLPPQTHVPNFRAISGI